MDELVKKKLYTIFVSILCIVYSKQTTRILAQIWNYDFVTESKGIMQIGLLCVELNCY